MASHFHSPIYLATFMESLPLLFQSGREPQRQNTNLKPTTTHISFYKRVGAQSYPGGKRAGEGRRYSMVKFKEEFMKDMKPEAEIEGAVGVSTVEKTGG